LQPKLAGRRNRGDRQLVAALEIGRREALFGERGVNSECAKAQSG
jgi:hypothetical protein